jgi:hypothetical protein
MQLRARNAGSVVHEVGNRFDGVDRRHAREGRYACGQRSGRQCLAKVAIELGNAAAATEGVSTEEEDVQSLTRNRLSEKSEI